VENRPELSALRTEIVKSKDETKLTQLAMKPDFTVGLGYMLMPAGSTARNAYMAEVTMNLPWLNRERHESETSRPMRRQMCHRRNSMHARRRSSLRFGRRRLGCWPRKARKALSRYAAAAGRGVVQGVYRRISKQPC